MFLVLQLARPMLAYFQSSNQRRFYFGAGWSSPQIQKLADRSDVISKVPKCSKIQIFRGSIPDPTGKAYSAPTDRDSMAFLFYM